MDENAWLRLKEIFHEAAERPPEERSRILERACGGDPALRAQIEGLLRASDGLDPSRGAPAARPRHDEDEPDTVVGRYRIVQKIGEGGFGVVYVAEQQEPVRRTVALKILRPGMATKEVLARFDAERQALACMDHQSIARVFDGGMTGDGRPYFVMELVRGIAIDRYCDQCRLPLRERLALFVEVCRAIQHAHQKGIIHRDLKPSNVLVTMHEGRPVAKVIDFGVAKALGQRLTAQTFHTQFAQMIGTPQYMSPEQAEMSPLDVDTRSDVYSLGVLLYELVTGTTPLDRARLQEIAFDELRRIIREEEPATPSSRLSTLDGRTREVAEQRRTDPQHLIRAVRGDLDWIIMKCLEKDRTRRYETAHDLVLDLGRYLTHEPVAARPPSLPYRMAKFARRHRAFLAAATLVAASLVAGLVGTGVGFVRARRERDRALDAEAETRREADRTAAEMRRANAVNELLSAMLDTARPSSGGPDTTVGEMLDRFASGLSARLPDQPEVEVRVRLTMANAYLGLARKDPAREQLGAAERRLEEDVDDPELRVRAKELRGTLEAEDQHYDVADRHFREALAERERLHGPESPATVKSILLLGRFLQKRGVLDESEALRRRAYAIAKESRDPALVAEASRELAMIFQIRGFQDDANRLLLETAGIWRTAGAPVELAEALLDLGDALLSAGGDPTRAEEALQEAMEIAGKRFPPDHPFAARILNSLGGVCRCRGDIEGAAPLLERAAAIARKNGGIGGSPAILVNLAIIYCDRREYERSEQVLREALAMEEKLLVDNHPTLAVTLQNLGVVLEAQGDDPGAVEAFERAFKVFQSAAKGDHPMMGKMRRNLAHSLHRAGRSEEAEGHARAALALSPAGSMDLADAYEVLGMILLDTGRVEEATEALRMGMGVRMDYFPKSIECSMTPVYIAVAWAHSGLRRDAEDILPVTIQNLERSSAVSPAQLRDAYSRAARLYEEWGKPEEAARLRARAR